MTLAPEEIARYLRMGRTQPEGALADRVRELGAAVCEAARPARIVRPLAWPAPGFLAEGSRTLARHLAGCSRAYLLCTTLGAGVDALLRRVSVVSAADAWIVQAAGAALIEKWTDACEAEIRAGFAPGETAPARYSPGYGDWPLAAQRPILAFLDAARQAGVSLTETLLLVPSKSVTAVLGVRAASEHGRGEGQ